VYLVMTSSIGPIPPLHRKYNEQISIEFIKSRYINLRNVIEKQVELLQHDELFCDKCGNYYKKGYKDWVILSTIHNCMMNWKANEIGLPLYMRVDREEFNELVNLLQGVVYPTNLFSGDEFEEHIKAFNFTCLRTYGFDLRQSTITPEIADNIERFLSDRMNLFKLDLPHNPLFGKPPGEWPKL
jgi:hypothetical protein